MGKKPFSVKLNQEDLAFLMRYGKGQTQQLENALKKLKALEQNQPQQPITSDVPPGMPLNPEKQKALEQLKQETYEVRELPPPPCNFVSKAYIDNKLGVQMVYCDNKNRYPKEKHPLTLSLSACQQCWSRREWVKGKKEREADENPHAEPKEIEVPNCSNRYLNYKGAENDPQAIHDFGEKGKKIYCTQFGDWKTLEFCIDCFKGGKSTSIPIQSDVSELTNFGDVDA